MKRQEKKIIIQKNPKSGIENNDEDDEIEDDEDKEILVKDETKLENKVEIDEDDDNKPILKRQKVD